MAKLKRQFYGRQLKEYRVFSGKRYKRYHVLFGSLEDARFDAGIRRSMGYSARITRTSDSAGNWWVLWLRKEK